MTLDKMEKEITITPAMALTQSRVGGNMAGDGDHVQFFDAECVECSVKWIG